MDRIESTIKADTGGAGTPRPELMATATTSTPTLPKRVATGTPSEHDAATAASPPVTPDASNAADRPGQGPACTGSGVGAGRDLRALRADRRNWR